MTQTTKTPPPVAEADAPKDGASYPALELDYALYESYLEDSEWTDAQKREFLETMWSIIVQFVDFGIGIHPVQQAGESVDIPDEFLSPAKSELLDSSDSFKAQLSLAADGERSSSRGKESK